MMHPQANSPPAGRTLVVVLSMHRSGSSLTMNLLQRLGMSLGPFELIGPLESNRHGHFEPVPLNHLNMRLQQQVFGFDGDMPQSSQDLADFLQSEGRWEPDAALIDAELERGREMIRQLAESAAVSGFKDPRVVLMWPYWSLVLAGFPQLRTVLLTLLRSPHEVAMSVFMRGKGRYSYAEALDVVAVNLRRIGEIRRRWGGPQATVRFDPRVLQDDLRQAAALCGVAWQDDVFRAVYDPSDRHHEAVRIAHDAQEVFDQLSGLPEHAPPSDAARLARDAALREKLLQSQYRTFSGEVGKLQAALEQVGELAATIEADRKNMQIAEQSLRQAVEQEACRLADVFKAECGRLQAQCEEERAARAVLESRVPALESRVLALESRVLALESRVLALESHPLLSAMRRIGGVYRLIRGPHDGGQDVSGKAA